MVKRLKVYQINSVCGTGSTGRIVCDIKDTLEKSGNECRIAYGRGFFDNPDCFKIENDLTFKTHVLFSRFTDKQGFYSTAATKRLVRDIEEYNPDIIHLHNIHGYYLNVFVLFEFLKKFDRPVVWTFHDCWPFTGHCAYFSFAGCEKWKNECCKCPQKKAYPTSILMDNSKNSYAKKRQFFTSINNLTIVTPSDWLAGLVSQSFLGHYPIKTINNGIDLNVFKPTYGELRNRLGLTNKKVILGVANVWEERKGMPDFLRLANILGDEYKVVLVGLTKKQKAQLPNNVTGICRTNSVCELAELYTMAEYFVNATYEDNYPTTNLEALSCGTPIIVYKTGGCPESVAPNCGAVVEAGDIEAVKKAILSGGFNREDCLEYAKTKDKNLCFARYVDLYNDLLKG